TPPPSPAHPLGKRYARSGLDWASHGPIKAHLARTMSRWRKRAPTRRSADRLRLGMWAAAGAEPRARWSGRLVGDPLLHVLRGRCVSRVLDFALIRQRGSNRGYSNLAVAAVEIRRVAAGIIAGLRRIVLGHLLLRGDSRFTLVRLLLARFTRARNGERVRPKCATNRVLS